MTALSRTPSSKSAWAPTTLVDGRQELGPHRAHLADPADRRPVCAADEQLDRAGVLGVHRDPPDSPASPRRSGDRPGTRCRVRAPTLRPDRPEHLHLHRHAPTGRHPARLEDPVCPVLECDDRCGRVLDVDRAHRHRPVAAARAAAAVADRIRTRQGPFRVGDRRQSLDGLDFADQVSGGIGEAQPVSMAMPPPASAFWNRHRSGTSGSAA